MVIIAEKIIMEEVATAYEIIHQSKRTKSNGYLLKIDFEKIYDLVNWDCLIKTMRSWNLEQGG